MIVRHDQGEVMGRLVRCADGQDLVRAVLLTSTRARPRAPVDVLSDYDVGLVLEDIRPFPLPHARALFRRVAVEVADDLGYAYPHDLDWRVTEYVPAIRDLDPGSADR